MPDRAPTNYGVCSGCLTRRPISMDGTVRNHDAPKVPGRHCSGGHKRPLSRETFDGMKAEALRSALTDRDNAVRGPHRFSTRPDNSSTSRAKQPTVPIAHGSRRSSSTSRVSRPDLRRPTMLSRELLAEAATLCCASRTDIGPSMIQRRLRVGFATAAQLGEALEDAGVLGENTGRRAVLVADPAWANTLIARAIESGRIRLTDGASR